MKVLVFSDLHIGSIQSSATCESIKDICIKENPDEVVFAGDTFEFLVSKENSFFNYLVLRVLLAKFKVVFLKGNHDTQIGKLEYNLEINNKKVKIIHGYEFEAPCTLFCDPILVPINEFILKYFKVNIQQFLRKITSKQYPEGIFPKKLYKQRCKVIKYLRGDVDILISGHTHVTEITRYSDFTYANAGNWENYLVLDEEGVRIEKTK